METDAAAAGDEADIGDAEVFFMDFQQSSGAHFLHGRQASFSQRDTTTHTHIRAHMHMHMRMHIAYIYYLYISTMQKIKTKKSGVAAHAFC